MTAVRSEVTVSRAIPLGSIPKRAVELVMTEFLTGNPFIIRASKKRANPKGMMIFPVKREIFARLYRMRELIGLRVLASVMSLLA